MSAMVRAAITIFAVLAVIYVGTTYYLSQRVEAARQLGLLATTLQQFQTQLLQLRRNEKDFLDRKTAAELNKHTANYEKTLAVLARARANPEAASDDIAVLDNLSKKTADYRTAFLEAAKQQTALGFDENSGLQGTLRKAVRELESVVLKLGDTDAEVRVLSFRRHEKDFILREREEYVKNFETVMKDFKERLANSKFDTASQQRISALLATYDTAFHEFAVGTRAVNTAVGAARAAAQAAEDPVAALVAKGTERSAAAEDAAFRTLLISAVFLVAVLGGLSILLVATMRAANATLAERILGQQKAEDENEMLNNSVISILQAVNQLSQRDLTARAPVTQDIIGTVSDSINALTDETAKVLHGVTLIAGLVESGSSKVKTQATLVSQTAADERESVNQMIGSLGDASSAMTQVAELAEQSNRSAEQATQATATALDTV
ncbi:MAG: methyl-accepting chemotaxis protein, partial [Bdellovibrionales bacterium]|nr:methyl-accepting chemotaxis protein [Massilia sp.]